MAPSQQQRPRQDPVSCESCRKKKLKCNRQNPCANCLSRHIQCEFKQSVAIQSTRGDNEDVESLRTENIDIKTRLERLEEILYDKHACLSGRPSKSRRLDYGSQTATGQPSPAATITDSTAAEVARDYRCEFRWLDGVGSQENTRLQRLALPFVTRIRFLEDIVGAASIENDEHSILLPPFEQTMTLVNLYLEQIDPVQHVVHCPTVKRGVRGLFDQLEQGRAVEPNQAVLVLSMLASLASFWGLESTKQTIFSSHATARGVGQLWLRRCLDVLEYVRRSASANLETIQASLITIFLMYNLEGYSPIARAMQFQALGLAKELGLHRTDDPSATTAVSQQIDEVEKEVRRRIWWHIVATDWSMANGGDMHEGTYNVHPKHMRVNLPRNVNDEELVTMLSSFQHPLSEPTLAGYHLTRIRIGEICREIGDLRWQIEMDEIATDDIKYVDRKFATLLTELPLHLRMDRPGRALVTKLERMYPIVQMQRYVVNLIIHSKWCKFHLGFLHRASMDPNYYFSREACLRAARSVIQIRQELLAEPDPFWLANARLCGVVHMVFHATVVLVMDLCINKDSECDAARKSEIQAACQTLEDAKRYTPSAGLFLDGLMAILRKHKINLQGQEPQSEPKSVEMPATSAPTHLPGSNTSLDYARPAAGIHMTSRSENVGLGELWQSYIDMEPGFDWDALINDIENMQNDGGSLGLDLRAL